MSCNRGLVSCILILARMCFHARKLYGWGLERYAKRRLFVGGGGIDVPRCPNAVVVAKGGGEEGGEDEDLLNYLWRQTNQPFCCCCCVLNSPSNGFPLRCCSLYFSAEKGGERKGEMNESFAKFAAADFQKRLFEKWGGTFQEGRREGGNEKETRNVMKRQQYQGAKLDSHLKKVFSAKFFSRKKRKTSKTWLCLFHARFRNGKGETKIWENWPMHQQKSF